MVLLPSITICASPSLGSTSLASCALTMTPWLDWRAFSTMPSTLAYFLSFSGPFAKGLVRWRFSLIVAALYALFSVLESINSLPSVIHDYNTTTPYAGFLIDFYLRALWSGVSNFFQIFALAAAAETIYRISMPTKFCLKRFFLCGLATRQTFEGAFAGLGAFWPAPGLAGGFITLLVDPLDFGARWRFKMSRHSVRLCLLFQLSTLVGTLA